MLCNLYIVECQKTFPSNYDNAACSHLNTGYFSLAVSEEEGQQLIDFGLFESPKGFIYGPVEQASPEKDLSLVPLKLEGNPVAVGDATGESKHDYPAIPAEENIIQHSDKKEIMASGSSIRNKVVKPPKTNLSSQLVKKDESKLDKQGKFPTTTIPRYLNLEPSLAMDWLEISWDELHIKERVGAGMFYSFLIYYNSLF